MKIKLQIIDYIEKVKLNIKSGGEEKIKCKVESEGCQWPVASCQTHTLYFFPPKTHATNYYILILSKKKTIIF